MHADHPIYQATDWERRLLTVNPMGNWESYANESVEKWWTVCVSIALFRPSSCQLLLSTFSGQIIKADGKGLSLMGTLCPAAGDVPWDLGSHLNSPPWIGQRALRFGQSGWTEVWRNATVCRDANRSGGKLWRHYDLTQEGRGLSNCRDLPATPDWSTPVSSHDLAGQSWQQ